MGCRLCFKYVEVETKDRAGPGGGLQEEGELIQVVELSVEQAREYIRGSTL